MDKTYRQKPTVEELDAILNGPPCHMEIQPNGEVADLDFRAELEKTINRFSMENGSNTPDFILARYLHRCLSAFDEAMKAREGWYAPESPDQPTQLELNPERTYVGVPLAGIGK